jgi:nucleotide-binding universal stress UspA family protein
VVIAQHGLTARVVVGVDGSEASRRALQVAVSEAELRHCLLVIVTAWSLPASPYPIDLDVDAFEADANELLHDSVDEVRSLAKESIESAVMAVHDDPRSALLDIVTEADILVLGSRGGGALADLVLGSVASYCVRHAPCPVLVVPASSRK